MADQPSQSLYGLLTENPNRIYVIAEASLNHGGNREGALALLRAAKWTGADAVNFQAVRTDAKAQLKKLELPSDVFTALHKEAKRLGIELLSTAFDKQSADFLDKLGVNLFKIAAADITNRALIEHVAGKGKPVLLSTGMNNSKEIKHAIDWMHAQANQQVVLLHCVPSYPAEQHELNLKAIQYLRGRFGVPVGFSDHSVGSLGSVVATSLGAQVIERRLMLEMRGASTDIAVSMDAKTLKAHIEELRTIGAVLGERGTFASEDETPNDTKPRRARRANHSIAAAKTIEIIMP